MAVDYSHPAEVGLSIKVDIEQDINRQDDVATERVLFFHPVDLLRQERRGARLSCRLPQPLALSRSISRRTLSTRGQRRTPPSVPPVPEVPAVPALSEGRAGRPQPAPRGPVMQPPAGLTK
eukprot:COSAG02_NODE_14064_length_1314_cov_1.790123_1_plen_120_part_10